MVYAAVIKSALAGKFIGDLGSRQSIFIQLGTLSHLPDEDFSKICPPLKTYQVFLFCIMRVCCSKRILDVYKW